jgi:hypothetical protein
MQQKYRFLFFKTFNQKDSSRDTIPLILLYVAGRHEHHGAGGAGPVHLGPAHLHTGHQDPALLPPQHFPQPAGKYNKKFSSDFLDTMFRTSKFCFFSYRISLKNA